MGSVMSNATCPSCEFEGAQDDFYYKTGEQYMSCPRCGYFEGHTILSDEDGNFKRYKSGAKKGEFKWKHEITKGGISFRYRPKGAVASSCGGIPKRKLNDFLEWVQNNRNTFEEVFITYKENNKWLTKDVLSGNVEDFSYNGMW